MKISVCVATYNGQMHVREQLESILNQLSEQDEVIISDDGSNDNTIQIIESLEDKRISIFVNQRRKGATGNFENALSHCNGDYIFLADQDDVWLPNKVALCKSKLEKYDLIVSNCSVTDENLNITYPSYFKIAKSKKGFIKNFFRSSYLGCCLAFRRELLEAILPIPKSLLLYHDWWIGFIADFRYNVYFIDTPCMLYRRHSSTATQTAAKSVLPIYKRLTYRFQLLLLGSLRLIKLL